MNDFHEAVLSIEVESSLAKVYKKAIEAENSPYRENWNGNHAHVQVESDDYRTGMNTLVISLLSHTLPNLQETIEWYERMGAKVIRTNYKGEN